MAIYRSIEEKYCPRRKSNIPLEVVYDTSNGSKTELCMIGEHGVCDCQYVGAAKETRVHTGTKG